MALTQEEGEGVKNELEAIEAKMQIVLKDVRNLLEDIKAVLYQEQEGKHEEKGTVKR